MSIILRTNKGKALSYDEMDRNQSQFFYSSSLHNDNTRLRLHYTGSENLDTATEDYGPNRYQEINLPALNTDSLTATAAGNTGDIQFNTDGQFDALGSFKFDRTQKFLGIGTGTPEEKLDIRGDGYGGASINLKGSNNPFNEAHTKHASINFYESSTYIGQIGRVDSSTNDLYFTNNIPVASGFGKVHIGIGAADNSRSDNADSIVAATFTRTSGGISRVGIGTKIPNRQLSLVGTEGIGLSTTSPNTNQSIIRPINAESEEDVFFPTEEGGRKRLVPDNSISTGLLLSSPEGANGGNIVIAINTDTNKKEGFNIINAFEGNYTNSEVIFSAQASGKVGINTNFPSVEGLTVEGGIVSSGDIVSSGNIEIEGTATIETIATGTAENTSALVATSTGLVQKIAAAPVPLGGIIMWSGNTEDIPDGWALCEGTTVNGIYVPDLTNRFIVGAVKDSDGNNTYPDLRVKQENSMCAANAVLVAHEHTLTINQCNHGHDFTAAHESGGGRDSFGFPQTDCNCARLHRANTGSPTSMSKTSIGGGYYQGNAIGGSKACILTTSKANKTGLTSSGLTSSTQTGANANLPPYYSLAFIMYVG